MRQNNNGRISSSIDLKNGIVFKYDDFLEKFNIKLKEHKIDDKELITFIYDKDTNNNHFINGVTFIKDIKPLDWFYNNEPYSIFYQCFPTFIKLKKDDLAPFLIASKNLQFLKYPKKAELVYAFFYKDSFLAYDNKGNKIEINPKTKESINKLIINSFDDNKFTAIFIKIDEEYYYIAATKKRSKEIILCLEIANEYIKEEGYNFKTIFDLLCNPKDISLSKDLKDNNIIIIEELDINEYKFYRISE